MNYFSNVPTRLHRARTRSICLGLAALGASALIAGCGSSGSSSTITVGAENKADEALANSSSSTGPTGASGASAKTPTSGPLSKEPHITPPSGPAPAKLVTKEIVKGTGAEAKTGSAVAVNYVGALYKTGKVFDASWKRNEPFTFTLGKGQVIPGWEQGVIGMKVGGRRELTIPSALGYGAKGSPPSIPPNETLIFIVDLLSA